MKIGILSFDLASNSGPRRFALNVSKGLKNLGESVYVIAYSCDDTTYRELLESGVSCHYVKNGLSRIDGFRSITDSRKVARKMMKLLTSVEKCDVYIVLSDELIRLSQFRTGEFWVYLSQGDMAFLYLNELFLKRHAPISNILAYNFVYRILHHKDDIRKYDLLISNSQFTSELMSFFLDSFFVDYVYPPVDRSQFKHVSSFPDNKYVLAILRNRSEPLAKYVEEIADSIPVKIVGKATIKNAQTLGILSEEELIKTYSNATATITASMQEFFGYSTAESLSCGTPVIAFPHGGAKEMIINGKNGWMVDSREELLLKCKDILREGYPESVRRNCRDSSEKFSIEESSKRLLAILNRYVHENNREKKR